MPQGAMTRPAFAFTHTYCRRANVLDVQDQEQVIYRQVEAASADVLSTYRFLRGDGSARSTPGTDVQGIRWAGGMKHRPRQQALQIEHAAGKKSQVYVDFTFQKRS